MVKLSGSHILIKKNEWTPYSTAQRDDCDDYAICGVYGICKIDESPKCECMKGFRPKFQSNWDMADWSNGCIRSTRLDCQKGDGFVKYSGVKLPDTRNSWFNESMNLKECASMCLRNCSCTAYANSDIRGGGSGCLLWFGDLIDIRDFTQNGQEFYVRMAASELGMNFSFSCLRNINLIQISWYIYSKVFNQLFTLHTCL